MYAIGTLSLLGLFLHVSGQFPSELITQFLTPTFQVPIDPDKKGNQQSWFWLILFMPSGLMWALFHWVVPFSFPIAQALSLLVTTQSMEPGVKIYMLEMNNFGELKQIPPEFNYLKKP